MKRLYTPDNNTDPYVTAKIFFEIDKNEPEFLETDMKIIKITIDKKNL